MTSRMLFELKPIDQHDDSLIPLVKRQTSTVTAQYVHRHDGREWLSFEEFPNYLTQMRCRNTRKILMRDLTLGSVQKSAELPSFPAGSSPRGKRDSTRNTQLVFRTRAAGWQTRPEETSGEQCVRSKRIKASHGGREE